MFSKKLAALALAGAVGLGATAAQAWSVYTDQYLQVYSSDYGMAFGYDLQTGAWSYRGEGSGWWNYVYPAPLEYGQGVFDILYTYDASYGWYYSEWIYIENNY